MAIFPVFHLFVWQANSLSQIEESFELCKKAVTGEESILKINRDLNYCLRLMRSIMLGDDFNKDYNKLLLCITAIQNSEKDTDAIRRVLEELLNKLT